jgi:hypothetical protein
VLAIAVSAVFVLSAPYIGQIRSSIKASFPQQFVAIVGGLVAVIIDDREIGVFDSRYSKETLTELDAVKREEWRVTPLPLTVRCAVSGSVHTAGRFPKTPSVEREGGPGSNPD